jgi:hypothetical protein
MYARYILQIKPNARIAFLYQNEEYGKGYLNAFKAELGDEAAQMIVREEPYCSHDRFADRLLEGIRRGHVLSRDDTQVRRSSDPEELRDRMEADADRPDFGRANLNRT